MASGAKWAALSAVFVGAVVTLLVLDHDAWVRLEGENQALRLRLEQLGRAAAENQQLSNLVAQAPKQAALPSEQLQELLKLRDEGDRLRQALVDMRVENRQLRTAVAGRSQTTQQVSNPFAPEPLIPAEGLKFINTDLRQTLAIYRELAGAQMDIDEAVMALPALIHFTNTEAVSRADALRRLDKALFEQAGILVTHPETNRVVMRLGR